MNKTKQAIFESAIKIFSTNGYNGATMDDIAQNAGVAKGTLYYHFKSKEEIFSFIIKYGLLSIKEHTVSEIEKESDDVEKLKVFCKTQLSLVDEYKDFLKVVISQLWGDNSRHLELRNELFEYAKLLESYVKMAIDNNLVKDDDTFLLSVSILGSVCSLAIHQLMRNDKSIDRGSQEENENPGISAAKVDNEKITDKLMEYLLDGIGLQHEKN